MKYKVRVTRISHKLVELDFDANNDQSAMCAAEDLASDIDYSDISETDSYYECEILSKDNRYFDEFFKELSECSAVFIDGVLSEVCESGFGDEMEYSFSGGNITFFRRDISIVSKEGSTFTVELKGLRTIEFLLLYFKHEI